MYNALILVSLLPLSGPDAGEHLAAMTPPAVIRYDGETVDPAREIPVLPEEGSVHRAAYTPDGEPRNTQMFPPLLAEQPQPPIKPRASASPGATPAAPAATTEPNAAIRQTPPAPRNPNLIQTRGFLEVPKRNHVELAAAYQSVLMSLQTQQRDADGQPVHDAAGRPVMVPLAEGMYVQKDQQLGNFDDRELQSRLAIAEKELEVAISEKEKEIEVRFAAISVQIAVASRQLLLETNKKFDRAVTQAELLKAELEVEQAKANLDLQRYTLDKTKAAQVAVKEEVVKSEEVGIDLRRIVSPIDGMIVRIDKAEGEWLREGDKVLEIINLETLRAKCQVDARLHTSEMVEGKNVTVQVPMVDGRTVELPGTVVFADPRVLYPAAVFEVFIEVRNQRSGRHWLLQPGREVTAVIHLQ